MKSGFHAGNSLTQIYNIFFVMEQNEFVVGTIASRNTKTVGMKRKFEINFQNKDLNVSKNVSANFSNT